MSRQWTGDEVLEVSGAFQEACVLAAGAELDVFSALSAGAATTEDLAGRLPADLRGLKIVLDALAAIELLDKQGDRYALAPGVADALVETGSQSVLAMVRHRANCLRGWAQLAKTVRTGRPAERASSIRGPRADQAAFIEAMEVASRRTAPALVKALGPPPFRRLLDVGCGPGTWTIAFLQARPEAAAILYDLPEVIPLARRHMEAAGLSARVTFVPGSFSEDPALPGGADVAWVSAIAHQNSRAENRQLLAKVHAALAPGGRVLLRDVVMDESRTSPSAGALFAVNMLVNTPGGGTYTFAEYAEDLAAAGFRDAVLLHRGEQMDSVVQATKA